MKITPLEIRQHAFEKIFRGYNVEEVDTFLANLSQEWERVLNESKMLRMQLEIAEKEAGKLREIEMTLFKTLKTAEDTSTMITDQANQQAEKYLQEAHLKSENITNEAKENAANIIKEAELQAKYIKEEVLGEVKGLERDFKAMDHYKDNLLVQMKSLANATINHVERFESKFDKEGIEAKFKEATTMIEQKIPVSLEHLNQEQSGTSTTSPPLLNDSVTREESTPTDTHSTEAEHSVEDEQPKEEIAEKAGDEHETHPVSVEEHEIPKEPVIELAAEKPFEEVKEEEIAELQPQNNVEEDITPEPVSETIAPEPINPAPVEVNTFTPTDNLKNIEGIGPKIEEILNNAGIQTFKDLATTPTYRIKHLLETAGSHYASHDPTTWGEQAKLAAEGNWEELKELQDRLMGGRPEPVMEEVQPEPPVIQPKAENKEQITEEMLEKVNKVKAAIRKAMSEKAETQSKDHSPLPTVNDVVSKNEGGSFFDNL